MIQIRIDATGKFLDLPPAFGLKLSTEGALFRKSVTAKTYSYPVSVIWTRANLDALGYSHLPQLHVTDNTVSWAVTVMQDGVEDFKATMKVQRFRDTGVELYLLREELPASILDTRLRDVDLGGDRVIVPTLAASMRDHAMSILDADANGEDYCFGPIENPDFYQNGITYYGVVNMWKTGSGATYGYLDNPTESWIFTGPDATLFQDPATVPTYSPFVPFPFLLYVLRKIAEQFRLSLGGDFVTEPGVEQLVIYNTYALDLIEEKYSATYSSDYYVNLGNANINLQNHVPDITVGEFLQALGTFLNLNVDIGASSLRIDILDTIARSPAEEDLTPYLSAGYEGLPGTGTGTGVALTTALDANDAWAQKYAGVVVGDEVVADYADPDFVTITGDEAQYNAVAGEETPDFSSFPAELKLGDGGLVLKESGAGTLATYLWSYVLPINTAFPLGPLYRYVMPRAEQPGNSPAYPQIASNNDFSLRFLLYCKEQKIMPTTFMPFETGPLLTSVGYDRDGYACSRFQLKLLGETNVYSNLTAGYTTLPALYPKWHRRWAELLRGKRTYTFPLRLTRQQLKDLDTRKKYRIGQRLYLIRLIEATQTHAGLREVKVTVVQVG